jgi:hypothetical protein
MPHVIEVGDEQMPYNELLQASIDQVELVKSCSEDNPISRQNISKI